MVYTNSKSSTRVISSIDDVSQYQNRIQMYIDVSRFSQYVCKYRSRGAQRCEAARKLSGYDRAVQWRKQTIFLFLEPIEDGKYYEFVLIRTDTTRGPKSVKGNENHIFALVLIFFRLDYDEKPQRIPVV